MDHLKEISPLWKQYCAVRYTRAEKKYDQIYKKVHYLTTIGGGKKKFLTEEKEKMGKQTPNF